MARRQAGRPIIDRDVFPAERESLPHHTGVIEQLNVGSPSGWEQPRWSAAAPPPPLDRSRWAVHETIMRL
jgi:hypothetical protein